jgi:hypothetical protein
MPSPRAQGHGRHGHQRGGWLEWLPTLTSHGSAAPDSGTRSPIDGKPVTA